jgi:hypothetical protein
VHQLAEQTAYYGRAGTASPNAIPGETHEVAFRMSRDRDGARLSIPRWRGRTS